jgi:hypothetical protein
MSSRQNAYCHLKRTEVASHTFKNEMPRVLLSGESDLTTQQEEECIQAFRDTAEDALGRHHRAFLGAFK